jgi:hypothetical protein
MDDNAALALRPEPISLTPTMVIPMAEVKRRIEELRLFVKEYMVEGEDYGKIPGTDRPTLLKPGAEKLCDVYGLTPQVDILDSTIERDPAYIDYTIRVRLVSRSSGITMAEGVGNCNSYEGRYRWRWVFSSELPSQYSTDAAKATLTVKTFKGKSGKSFVKYRIENDDIWTLKNTILKQAKKRALIDAVLSATRSSGILTQDVEELREFIANESTEEDPKPSKPSQKDSGKAPSGHANADLMHAVERAKLVMDEDRVTRLMMVVGCGQKSSQWAEPRKKLAADILDAMASLIDPALYTPDGAEALFMEAGGPGAWDDSHSARGLTALLDATERAKALESPLPDDLGF